MNTDSIIFYQALITDCNDTLKYWTTQPDSDDKAAFVEIFTKLKDEHQKNLNRLLTEIKDTPAAITEIESWVDLISSWIAKFGEDIPADVKKWFMLLLKAAHTIIEVLKKLNF